MFKVLFGLAAVIAAGATYLAVTDTSPNAAAQPGLLWLLIANLVLIAGVATVLGVRVYQLVRENRETNGGARLRLRIIFLFSLTAAIPTVLVAGFLAVAINRSVDGWFGAPVTNIVARRRRRRRRAWTMCDWKSDAEVQAMANDLNNAGLHQRASDQPGGVPDRELLGMVQAPLRDFARATIVCRRMAPSSSTGQLMAHCSASRYRPQAKWCKDAREGAVGGIVDAARDHRVRPASRPIQTILCTCRARSRPSSASGWR